MAQSGFTPIQLYFTTTAAAAPSAGNLANGELAINITDGRLFYKDNGGTVRVLAGTGGSGVVAGSNTQVQFNNNGVFGASANMVFNGTRLTVADLADSGLTSGRVVYAGSGGALVDSAALTFDGTNLGIGTSSPGAKLDIQGGSITVGTTTAGNSTVGMTFGKVAAGGGTINNRITLATYGGAYGAYMEAYADLSASTATYLAFGTTPGGGGSPLERMRIDSSGNLGIGTSSPAYKLVVSAAGASGLEFGPAYSGTSNLIQSYNRSGGAYVNTVYDAANHVYNISGAEQMRLTSTGLGIGTSSPLTGLTLSKSGTQWTNNSSNSYPVPAGRTFLQMEAQASQANWFGFTGSYGATSGSANLLLQVNLNNTNQQAGNYIGSEATSASSADLTFGRMVGGATTGSNSTKSEQMRLDSSGNLGLGVTPSAWGSGQRAIQTPAGAIWNFNAFNMTITQNAFSDGTEKYIGNGFASKYNQNSGAHQWSTAPSGTAGNAISFSQAMTLDASGRLGIGQTSPAYKLDIRNDVPATTSLNPTTIYMYNNTDGGSGIEFLNAVAGKSKISFGVESTGSGTDDTYIGFSTCVNGGTLTERARIDSSGNLLVGTTSQFYLNNRAVIIQTASTNSGSALAVATSYSGDVGNAAFFVGKFDNNSTTSQVFARFLINAANNANGQINANGAGAAAFGSWSDRRLKENITDLTSQLANVMALRPVEFDYIESEGGGHQTGFIAQEMQDVYPDAVGERAPDGMLTVTGWDKTTARLVKAIQEQQAIITTLTARVAALESN